MRLPLLLAVVVCCAVRSLSGAEPLLEKVDLFAAGDAGFALYRIPGIVVTPRGTVLAYCEARKLSGADYGEIEVHLRRSTDGGKTWEPARQIAHMGHRIEGLPTRQPGSETQQTVNNPVAIVDALDGIVHFLYCVNYERCFYMRSEDDGLTFSQPVEITASLEKFRDVYPWTVIATGPGHGIQLTSGRLLSPVWLASGKNGAHKPSVTATIYSDDKGKTWKCGEIALPDTPAVVTPSETVAVQLADGRVMLNARSMSKASRRLTTISPDGATQWSRPHFEKSLWEPICMGSIVRLSDRSWADKNRLVFSNPHNLKLDENGKPVPGGRGERRNLSIKLSDDDGKTWTVSKTLEPGGSAYSDLAALPDQTLLCLYERGRDGKGSGGLLTVARFNLEWLTDGKDSIVAEMRSSYGAQRDDFQIAGCDAFVIHPKNPDAHGARPWVWYAPTIGHHPSSGNEWLLTRLLERGFYVAGIYVGETFANPLARERFDRFYRHVTRKYELDPKVCLLPQSRGGLNHYNFAADHPDRVRCIAGIFPVGDLRSFPKLARAAPSYSLTEAGLEAELANHNPVDRLAPIAKAGIPILHLHGDADKVVPLEQNSQAIHDRYVALGGSMELIIVPGKGHQNDPGFFESQAMLDFLLRHGKGG